MRGTIKNLIHKARLFTATFLLLAAQAMAPVSAFIPKTSAAPVCVSDTAGANDEPGQKDLTQKCEESAPPAGTEVISWNWDDTGTSGGGQSLDACGLFDSDGDSNINFSICVTTTGDPATLGTVTIYECEADSKHDRCGGQKKINGNYDTVCTVTQQNTNPFDAGSDTVASCNFVLSDLPGSLSSLVFTDVCSYPSRQPNSDPSDCVIIQPDPIASVELIKDLNPANDSGLFDLTINAPGTADDTTVADRTDGGTTGAVTVHPTTNDNDVTVSEAAGNAATVLSNYSSAINCVRRGTETVVASGMGTSLTFSVTDGDDIVCTITNTRQGGTIIVDKVTLPAGDPQSFSFDASGGSYTDFSLTDQAAPNSQPLAPGSYSVTETVPAGWALTSTSCVSSIGDTESAANLELDSNETITCTFTNTKQSKIIIEKQTNPNGDPAVFDFNPSWSGDNFTLSDDQQHDSGFLAPGTYSVEELTESGWDLTNTTCSDQSNSGSINLSAGETVTCTFTNTKRGSITIIKNTIGGDGTFSFTNNFGVTPITTAGGTGSQTVSNLVPGNSYNISEVVPSGWSLNPSPSCTNGTTSAIVVTAGQTTTCTFTNTKLGSISGYKYEVDDDGEVVGPLAGWIIELFISGGPSQGTETTDDNGFYEFLNLVPDNYTVSEDHADNPDNWTQLTFDGAGETCTSETHSIELSAGENSTDNDFCNFENGSISGYKFNDLNGNAVDDSEPKLSGWTFNLKLDTDKDTSFSDEAILSTDITDGSGFSFSNLEPGFYQVCEVQQDGWVRTLPISSDCHTTTIDESGESVSGLKFGNQGRGTITVNKNVDTDGDGEVDITGATDWTWDYNGQDSASNVSTGTTVNVAAGTYEISEDQEENYHFTSVVCSVNEDPFEVNQDETVSGIVIEAGDTVACTFTNTRDTGTITVRKVIAPTDDEGLFDIHINDQVFENIGHGEGTGTLILPTDDYTVSEMAGDNTDLADYFAYVECTLGGQTFYQAESTTVPEFTLETGDDVVCVFYNTKSGNVVVTKFDDVNNDGEWDKENEPTLEGWDMTLETGMCEIASIAASVNYSDCFEDYEYNETQTTGADGSTTFTRVRPEVSHFLSEATQEGWVWTNTYCVYENTIGYIVAENYYELAVSPGETLECFVGNFKKGEVNGHKFEDVNGNRTWDEREKALSGWTINLWACVTEEEPEVPTYFRSSAYYEENEQEEPECENQIVGTDVTDENGAYSFEGLEPGDYTVCEVQQSGWTRTLPADSDCYEFEVEESGQVVTNNFGNKRITRVLGELVNTGTPMWAGLAVGLSILGLAGAATFLTRRQIATSNK